jgi:hypothetical protein
VLNPPMSVRNASITPARGWTVALVSVLLAHAVPLVAQSLPPVTVGAGVRTSYSYNVPANGDNTNQFALDSVRLYVNGSATDNIKIMFNTEYDGPANHVTVLDAVGQFHFSDEVNFWAGRFLPPSDRANLYGPYYAHHYNVFQDGVQDGYPFVATGRDNGFMYWGQFGIAKVSAGLFDGQSATGNPALLSAYRLQLDFWDPEAGYYLNGTYYGDKNLLAVGVAGQVQNNSPANYTGNDFNVDFLLERKISDEAGAYTIEGEWARYHNLGGYDPNYGLDRGGYVLASYLFPSVMGLIGRFEILGKYGQANFSDVRIPNSPDYSQKTTEINFNYLIKQFNARVMVYYLQKNFSAVQANDKKFGVGLQLQM